MGTRGRRRIDLALLAAAALLTGVVALVGAVAGRTERVPRLWAGAAVGPGGGARVVEAIDYDFGSRQRHGIYRDIPGLAAGDPVQVASPTAPAQLQVTGTSQQARLRMATRTAPSAAATATPSATGWPGSPPAGGWSAGPAASGSPPAAPPRPRTGRRAGGARGAHVAEGGSPPVDRINAADLATLATLATL